jgi:hypothetical protein
LVRRIVGWLLVSVFVLTAIYQATAAASAALELKFGVVYAPLLIAGFFAVAAIVTVAILWVTGRHPSLPKEYRASIARMPPELQVATLVEAMLLGYAMSRKK